MTPLGSRWCALVALLVAAVSCRRGSWPGGPPAEPVCDGTVGGATVSWQLGDSLGGSRPTADQVARWLVGTWNVTQIATEGVEHPRVEHWQLRLVATDDSVRQRSEYGFPGRTAVVYPAAGARLAARMSFDSAAAARRTFQGPQTALVRLVGEANRLAIVIPPGQGDQGGDGFSVHVATDTAFGGRWEWGGLAAGWVRRGNVTTFERRRGFFCATRVPEHTTRP